MRYCVLFLLSLVVVSVMLSSHQTTARYCMWRDRNCVDSNRRGPRGNSLACSLNFGRRLKCQVRGAFCWCLPKTANSLLQTGDGDLGDLDRF